MSTTLAGAALGSLSGGNLADALGRRKAFLLTSVPMLVGPLLCASASSFSQLAAGRAITGVAIGLSSALVPTYISEVGHGAAHLVVNGHWAPQLLVGSRLSVHARYAQRNHRIMHVGKHDRWPPPGCVARWVH